jgi:hypothetical protein
MKTFEAVRLQIYKFLTLAPDAPANLPPWKKSLVPTAEEAPDTGLSQLCDTQVNVIQAAALQVQVQYVHKIFT